MSAPNPQAGAVFVWAALHGMLSIILARQVNPEAGPDWLVDLPIRRTIAAFRDPL